jgi:hypothetical protein
VGWGVGGHHDSLCLDHLCEGVTSVWPSEPCLVHFPRPYRAFLGSQCVLLHSPDRHTDTSSHLVFCAHRFPHHRKRCSNSFALVCTSGCRVVCFVFCSVAGQAILLFPQHPRVVARKLARTQKLYQRSHPSPLYHPQRRCHDRKWAINPIGLPSRPTQTLLACAQHRHTPQR